MDYAEKEAYGITQQSTKFVRDNLKNLGSIVQIECLLAGNTYTELGGKEQWVSFSDEEGNQIVVSGFSWGYAGEGPHGLLRMAQELGFDLDMDYIAGYPKDEYWTIHRERMVLTQELAEYLISLQAIADMERGMSKDEYDTRHKLELEFPELREKRETEEFNQWLWATRVEAEPDVAEARALLGHDIPFDDIYHADDPDAEGSTYNLYREHAEVAGHLFRETKDNTDNRLQDQNDVGKIDLRQEWEDYRRSHKEEPVTG